MVTALKRLFWFNSAVIFPKDGVRVTFSIDPDNRASEKEGIKDN